jgi:hypothetical protein
MRSALLALAFVGAAAAARADSANLRLLINNDFVINAGESIYLGETLYNFGPDTARNVVITTQLIGFPGATSPCPAGCALGDAAPNRSVKIPQFSAVAPIADFSFTYRITVTTDTSDPDTTNNVAAITVRVSTGTDLHADSDLLSIKDPGLPFDMLVYVFNEGYSEAHDVVVTGALPAGVTVRSLPDGCSSSAAAVQCQIPLVRKLHDVGYHAYDRTLTFVAPPMYEGGKITFTLSARGREPDQHDPPFESSSVVRLYYTFLVTSTADDGSGSLRAAIAAMNAGCQPSESCAIQFNIAERSEHPWKTIRLRTPLPHLTPRLLHIDGETQSRFSGEPNPDGPPIEITGGGEVDGDGLWLSAGGEIAHLAINGFRNNGLALFQAAEAAIHDNYIGTDPTGSVAIPNFRGIGAYEQFAFGRPQSLSFAVTSNVISGNARSAIFAFGGGYLISNNRLGLKARADEPLPNGASGIYFHGSVGRVEMYDNAIAFNREMGVAVDSNAPWVFLQHNRIWGNGGQAIDDGLDGPSPFVQSKSGPFSTPVITAAIYDFATKTTILRAPYVQNTSNAEWYVSDAPGPRGAGDAQRFLGYTSYELNTGAFYLTVKEDLRGKWVSLLATTYQPDSFFPDSYFLHRTGELSRAVQVK